jgi:hypothetical protein
MHTIPSAALAELQHDPKLWERFAAATERLRRVDFRWGAFRQIKADSRAEIRPPP